MITVLMYHAIPAGAADEDGADPHYSVPLAVFARQLRLMAECGRAPRSVASLLAQPGERKAAVGITFDDGHSSNYAAAAMLRDVGGSADFFINPSTVGTANFLSWGQLREMAGWGMSIQSHGMHHRFLDDLAPAEVEAELADSKRVIEAELGRPVTLYAPAGGRQAPGMDALTRRLGYRQICSSRVALWNDGDAASLDIPRLAMLQATGEAQLRRWLRQSVLEMSWQRGRYLALRGAKRLLGNGFYVHLRGALLRDAAR
ncbi:MAG: polysaccharide deacetylase family protein [Burkholderiales bacterium]